MLVRLLGRFTDWLLRALATTHHHRGIRIKMIFSADEDGSLARITSALDIIHELDPARATSIASRLTGGIIVYEERYNLAWYSHHLRACCLSEDHAAEGEPEDIALSIIHQACHARLMQCGIG